MMNVFTKSMSRIFKGALQAFQTFPAAIASALAFSIVTMVRIQMDWPQQEAYNFLFNCLHWSFALGAVFSLAAITAAQSRWNTSKAFWISNILSLIAIVLTFVTLYFFGAAQSIPESSRFISVSGLAASRVGVVILVSFIAFVILASYPKEKSDFARTFFMTHKALFISLLYGGVIMAGASAVAGAIQALIYQGMSEKVYGYIATIVGFLTFTMFVGYFPDFRKGMLDEKREIAQKQPRFIEILFDYILIPIMLALTIVLLIWAGRSVISGFDYPFIQLSSIATGYAVGGIWLYIMVTHHESGLAKFYRIVYPWAALIILAFEARALYSRIYASGIQMTEYSFGVIWILAEVSVILLLIGRGKFQRLIAGLVGILAIITVLPWIGYHALPVTSQVNRLESLLVSQGMLVGDQLIPAAVVPEQGVREAITDAVNYLAYAEDANLPSWFDKKLGQSDVFKSKLGFEQTWPQYEEKFGSYRGVSIVLLPEAIDISQYRWVIDTMESYGKESSSVSLTGDRGVYQFQWTMSPPNGIPKLKILLNETVILEQDMNVFLDQITAAYPPGATQPIQAGLKDMSLPLETPELNILLVFSNVEIYSDPGMDVTNYWIGLDAIYVNEKPQ